MRDKQYNIIKTWKTTENLCILISTVSMFSAEQWDYVTVSVSVNVSDVL
jgi:hypothetical protein